MSDSYSDDMPDWLEGFARAQQEDKQAAQDEQPAASPKQAPKPPDQPLPDWLSEAIDEQTQAEPSPAAPSPAPSQAIPDWLSEAAASPPPPPTASVPESAPAKKQDIPDWLLDFEGVKDKPADPPAPPPQKQSAPAREIPDWLSDITPTAAEPVQPAAPELPPAEDWLAALGLAGEAPSGEAKPTPQAEDSPEAPLSEAVLGWLDDAGPPTQTRLQRPKLDADAEDEAASEASAPYTRDDDLAAMIQDLRFDAILRDDPAPAAPVGVLKDVEGVIRPELIFDGSSLKVEAPSDVLHITPQQVQRINLLNEVLAERESSAPSAARRRRLPLIRWLTAVVTLAVVSLPVLGSGPQVPSSAPSPGTEAAYVAAEALPTDAQLLLVVAYEPGEAPEMELIGAALIGQIQASAPQARFDVIGTRLYSPAAAAELAAEAGITPGDESWATFGYLPGQASGVRLAQLGGLNTSPDAIIVLAAYAEDLRPWIEQAAADDVTLIAGVSSGAGPLAQAYRTGGQLDGLLVGASDAAGYAALGNQPAAEQTMLARASQAYGAAAAAALILIGAAWQAGVYLIKRARR